MIVLAEPGGSSSILRSIPWIEDEQVAEIVGPLEVPEQVTLGLLPVMVTVELGLPPLLSLVLRALVRVPPAGRSTRFT